MQMTVTRAARITTGDRFRLYANGEDYRAAGDARVRTGRGDRDPDFLSIPVHSGGDVLPVILAADALVLVPAVALAA